MTTTCNECKFAVFEDNGYSNWTVEGTDFSCAKRLHPAGTFDRFYAEARALEHAEKCAGFEAGEPVRIDVDGDEVASLTDEERAVWMMHQGQNS